MLRHAKDVSAASLALWRSLLLPLAHKALARLGASLLRSSTLFWSGDDNDTHTQRRLQNKEIINRKIFYRLSLKPWGSSGREKGVSPTSSSQWTPSLRRCFQLYCDTPLLSHPTSKLLQYIWHAFIWCSILVPPVPEEEPAFRQSSAACQDGSALQWVLLMDQLRCSSQTFVIFRWRDRAERVQQECSPGPPEV